AAEWMRSPAPRMRPEAEARGYQTAIRIGDTSWPDMVRERGYDPEAQLAEIAEWNARFDKAKVILDSDPRLTTQQGQPRATASAPAPALAPAANGNGAR